MNRPLPQPVKELLGILERAKLILVGQQLVVFDKGPTVLGTRWLKAPPRDNFKAEKPGTLYSVDWESSIVLAYKTGMLGRN